MNSHFITGWLAGNFLKSFQYIDNEAYSIEWLWLNIDHRINLHEAAEFSLLPFDESRRLCRDYINQACVILGREPGRPNRGPTDAATTREVLRQLGNPPQNSYSIYIITISNFDGTNERAVYVGKTNSKTNRFRSEHHAMSKLHHPKYDGMRKSLYLACVSAVNDDQNTFPVEWINPLDSREEILSDVEHQLIFHFKPELNEQGKNRCLANRNYSITTQNHSGDFFDCEMIGPDRPF